jgi:hemin uptake protein HemP
MKHRILVVLTLTLALCHASGSLADTSITYQGQLQQVGKPFTGTPEMAFRLFDGLSGGNQIGDTEFFMAVSVIDGLFQVELDFGAGAFDGGAYWLEIEVAGNILQPRQKISGSPWSHRAMSVAAGSVGADQADSDQIQLRITGTCGLGTTLVGVNPDGSVACAVLPLGVAYVADSSTVVNFIAIAIRDDGLPIISYRATGNLKVFDCANTACSSGIARTLDSDGNVGAHTSIAIRNDGLPIISYRDSTNQNLKAYDCANAACSSGTARTLYSDGDVGEHTAIAIRDNGHPIISHLDRTNFNLKVFDCANAACSSGATRTLDSGGNVGFDTSIAIRNDGLPIISYRDSTNQNLKAYDCANAACSSGTARTLDSNGNVGWHSAIAIRDNGLPIISYHDSTPNNNLKAYDCSNVACSSGTARTLDSNGNVGLHSAIAIRDNGLPIISYRDSTNGNLKVYDCADVHCFLGGTARTLDSNGNVGEYTAIAIRDDGFPIISYRDVGNNNLKVFSCGDPQCVQ